MRGQLLVVPVLLMALAAGCSGRAHVAGGPLQVVAAENFWGSIAAQLGGDRVHVTSVVTSPATDPHDYEPTAADARTFADAGMVIENGVGYDPWAARLVAAGPLGGRVVLDVGKLAGVPDGGNPHRWYSPANVQQVIAAIVHGYSRLDPKDAGYFLRQKSAFETRLAPYKHLIATIKRRFGGTPVGASESIFAPLAQALGLRLVTPPSFLKAISEGTEPAAADKTAIDRQIARRQIEVWVYNSQNSTPDVARLTAAARKNGIPVTTVSETLSPASATFQAWQTRQLKALVLALARGVHP